MISLANCSHCSVSEWALIEFKDLYNYQKFLPATDPCVVFVIMGLNSNLPPAGTKESPAGCDVSLSSEGSSPGWRVVTFYC